MCGLRRKCHNGIINELVKQFDIVCLSETRTDQIDPNFFPEFYCIFADKKDPVHSFGGVHGLAILLSKKFDCKFQVLSETTCIFSLNWICLCAS